MPLTASGERVLQQFKKNYGGRGEEVFYRSLNSGALPASLEGDMSEEHPRTQTGAEPAPIGELPASKVARELAGRGDNIPWDGGWVGDGPFGAQPARPRDDEYTAPGTTETQSEPLSTGDQPENIGTLPEGGTLDPALEHPQEHPGTSAPPSTFPGDSAATTGGLQNPFGDASIGYGGIAGGVFKQEWGDQGPHPFADQLPGGMTVNEIQNWGKQHYWKQWER